MNLSGDTGILLVDRLVAPEPMLLPLSRVRFAGGDVWILLIAAEFDLSMADSDRCDGQLHES